MTMFGVFRGKLFSAGYWCNVAASWSSYLMRLEKDGSPQFEVDADGNVEAAGLVAAPQLDLGTNSTIDAASVNSAVLGGDYNELGNAPGCTISGDKNQIVSAEYSAIVGGIECVIGGGSDGSEASRQCFVAAGEQGSGMGHSCTNCSVCGGYGTTMGNGCTFDFIGGGNANTIGNNVTASVIGGGWGNAITGSGGAVIPGGYFNSVSGTYGIASGIGASAAHDGSVVWCDSTGATTPLASSAANEWTARATGGFRLYNAADGSKYAELAAGELTVSDKVVTPALKVTGGTPGAGKVLTSDADGDASWVNNTRTMDWYIGNAGHAAASIIIGAKDIVGHGIKLPYNCHLTGLQVTTYFDGANDQTTTYTPYIKTATAATACADLAVTMVNPGSTYETSATSTGSYAYTAATDWLGILVEQTGTPTTQRLVSITLTYTVD